MSELDIKSSGGQYQITIPRFAQITVSDEGLAVFLAGPHLQVIQEGARLIVRLNPRLGYTAPEAMAGVARDLGLTPYEYIRMDDSEV